MIWTGRPARWLRSSWCWDGGNWLRSVRRPLIDCWLRSVASRGADRLVALKVLILGDLRHLRNARQFVRSKRSGPLSTCGGGSGWGGLGPRAWIDGSLSPIRPSTATRDRVGFVWRDDRSMSVGFARSKGCAACPPTLALPHGVGRGPDWVRSVEGRAGSGWVALKILILSDLHNLRNARQLLGACIDLVLLSWGRVSQGNMKNSFSCIVESPVRQQLALFRRWGREGFQSGGLKNPPMY